VGPRETGIWDGKTAGGTAYREKRPLLEGYGGGGVNLVIRPPDPPPRQSEGRSTSAGAEVEKCFEAFLVSWPRVHRCIPNIKPFRGGSSNQPPGSIVSIQLETLIVKSRIPDFQLPIFCSSSAGFWNVAASTRTRRTLASVCAYAATGVVWGGGSSQWREK